MENGLDPESEAFLTHLAEQERVRSSRVPNVGTVLVVLSAAGMVYDVESLQQKIHLFYPDAAVFFMTTLGKPIRSKIPARVDLVIDFTGPGQRQSFFFAKRLRRMGRVVVGRNAGLFRKRVYDRVFDEKALAVQVPSEKLARERRVQKEVLELAGIAFVQSGDTPPDRGKVIALELPPMQHL